MALENDPEKLRQALLHAAGVIHEAANIIRKYYPRMAEIFDNEETVTRRAVDSYYQKVTSDGN